MNESGQSAETRSSAQGPRRADSRQRVLPANIRGAALTALGFTMLLYLAEFIDYVLPADLNEAGIQPREVGGLDGVLWAPLLHFDWEHLAANTIPVLLFGFLALASGVGRWVAVTATIWVLGGLGVWLTGGDGTVHIGASGLAFGWLAYLLVRGVFNRAAGQLVVAAVLLFLYGGMLWGVLPGAADVSWQGHLFGALAGVLAAWLVAKADRSRRAPKPVGPDSPSNLAA